MKRAVDFQYVFKTLEKSTALYLSAFSACRTLFLKLKLQHSTPISHIMTKDPFEEYIRHIEANKREKGYAWQTAIGLQDVDGLKPSRYLIDTAIRHIEGEISIDAAEQWISRYYEENPHPDNRTEEADKVSVRIAKLLSEPAFSFNVNYYLSIHRYLFQGIYSHAGQIRTYNITKKEWVLNGDTVSYGSALDLRETLHYDFEQERRFSYKKLSIDEIIEHLAYFVSRLWQIHVFGEGNTRTTAVFFIKYLNTLGFNVTNDSFSEHSWYFRNALVRANYNNFAQNIHETTEYLVKFIRNLLLGERHILSNRLLHVRSSSLLKGTMEIREKPGIFNVTRRAIAPSAQDIQVPKQDIRIEKQDIEFQKQDIKTLKQDIASLDFTHSALSNKTSQHIRLLHQMIGEAIFSRVEVIQHLQLTPSPASELIRKMLVNGIIEKVSGMGKGRYKFISS